MGSIQNIVRVALLQIGVIVAGVLGAGICHKISSLTERPMPVLPSVLYSYGAFGFIIPIVWVILALIICSREDASDTTKALIFWLGVLMVVALASLVLIVDGRGLMLQL
jgi:uncharacterized membrane protein